MIRLQNTPLARALHGQLYDRMLAFALEYTPELIASTAVDAWLRRLYSGDNTIHILINLDGHLIVEHAVIEIQEFLGQRIIVCHQNKHDKPNLANLDEGVEYMNKLANEVHASCQMFYVSKHSKALEKKYGFKIARVCMVKYNCEEVET